MEVQHKESRGVSYIQFSCNIWVILLLYPDDTRVGNLCSGHDCYVVNLLNVLVWDNIQRCLYLFKESQRPSEARITNSASSGTNIELVSGEAVSHSPSSFLDLLFSDNQVSICPPKVKPDANLH
jgi:hypothetical protein